MPHTSCLSAELEAAHLCNGGPGGNQAEVAGLVLAVMAERCLGTASRWDGYLSVLPSSLPGLPFLWPASDQALMEGTALLDKLRGSLALRGSFVEPPSQVKEKFEEVIAPFLQQYASAVPWPPSRSQSWQLYLWATAVVSAYAFMLGDDQYQAMAASLTPKSGWLAWRPDDAALQAALMEAAVLLVASVAQRARVLQAKRKQRKKEVQQLLQETGLQTQARQAVRAAARARLQQLAGSQPAVEAAVACQQQLPPEAGAEQGPTGQTAAGPAVQAPAELSTALSQMAAPGPGPQAPAKLDSVVVGREVDISGGMVGNGQNVGTNTCGTCLYVRCVAGPTRGLPNSKYPGPAPCLPGNPEVFVQITDSCPCTQNPSNFANCCNSRQSVTSAENATTVSRHLELPCGPNNGDDGAVWTSWEQHFNTTMATWSQNILAAYQDSGGVLLNVRSNTPIGPLAAAEATMNRTGEAQPDPKICGVR
eukprot:jgi/Astpho2/7744/fgenesh1_pg.00116_%23_12_t